MSICFLEAMHNTVKHARARKVDLRLSQTIKGVILEVRDNGGGIWPNSFISRPSWSALDARACEKPGRNTLNREHSWSGNNHSCSDWRNSLCQQMNMICAWDEWFYLLLNLAQLDSICINHKGSIMQPVETIPNRNLHFYRFTSSVEPYRVALSPIRWPEP